MNPFAPPPIFQKVPITEEPIAATLRALTHCSRAAMLPLLTEALSDCDCWTRSRSGSVTGMVLVFELPLRTVTELYLSLIECGLVFDRKGHCELHLLCTLGRHAFESEFLRRSVTLRLELTFVDELEPVSLRMQPVCA